MPTKAKEDPSSHERWDYPLPDINPVFPGLGEIIIIIIIIIIIVIVIIIIINIICRFRLVSPKIYIVTLVPNIK